ncbi:ring-cleaving dioxygenase [Salinarimonas soli]|uniref:Ring-cleaving dioxygenase n=1 Tax=Salinarimonas soli TaxID=1638099 RepID=A0A5B2VIN1_9HYPH|nr:ring-cleaving dioxygenase [Salinarimonas soli]KAA2238222.1 ring-cleaving dioxygenase [Salinarimonas soli]
MPRLPGIHHVTAIASDPKRNLDFYTRTLGLRLVKKTVNFDDPSAYHFYYGDEAGQPGTILTFFPWPGARQGRNGLGFTHETVFRVPESALAFWTGRLVEHGVAHDASEQRFGRKVLPFQDPDGLRLAIVGVPEAGAQPGRAAGDIPAEAAIRGFDGVTLLVGEEAPTAAVLTEAMGFTPAGRDGALARFTSPGGTVDLRVAPGFPRGASGAGTVHHVAFRAGDDAEQAAMGERLAALGLQATEQKDRTYFRSIYAREPGGVLFEIATDVPGFAVDEALGALGTMLKLPPQYEAHRAMIEAALPALD